MRPQRPLAMKTAAEIPEPSPRPVEPEKLFGREEKQLAITLLLCVGLALFLPFRPVKFGLAAVLGIVYFRQLLSRPDLALAIYVFALPVIDLLPPDLIPVRGLNPQTVLVVSLLARMFAEPSVRKSLNPFTWGLALFSFALVIGTFVSMFSHAYLASELLMTAKNHIIVIPVLFFVARVIRTDKQRKIVLLSMAFLLFLISAHTIWDTRDQIAAGLLLERHRATGLVAGQANLYGGWLAMSILGAICFLFSPVVRGKARLFLAGTTLMGIVALVYTLSRGSWLALGAAVAMVAVFRNRRILVLGTLAFLLLPALASPAVRERAASIVEVFQSMDEEPRPMDPNADESAMVRVEQWSAFPGLVGRSPLFGHGYGYFPELWFRTGHSWKAAHSSIIEIGSELGLLGLLGYAALVLPMVVLGWTCSRSDRPPLQRAVGTVAFGMGLCLLVLDSSGTRFRNSEVMANFWVIAGLLTGTWDAESVPAEPRPARAAATVRRARVRRT